jgi:hypothetical protein
MKRIKTSNLTGSALDWAVGQAHGDADLVPVAYSTDWAFGGLIIERERISVVAMPNGSWQSQGRDLRPHFHNPTPLIAAMRCYVASKLGDVIDVPIEIADPHHPYCPAVDGFGCHCDEIEGE